MMFKAKNNRQVFFRSINSNDYDLLYYYLQKLSDETKKRFGPHSFEKQAIIDFYTQSDSHLGNICIDIETAEIIAYSTIKIGYLEHDFVRFLSYGMTLDSKSDCAFAPSVADDWQSCGIGNRMFDFLLSDLKDRQIERVILWGGVQLDNDKAVNYYKKNNFKTLGQFFHNGQNYDMAYYVKQKACD